jgi:hypothetical protein
LTFYFPRGEQVEKFGVRLKEDGVWIKDGDGVEVVWIKDRVKVYIGGVLVRVAPVRAAPVRGVCNTQGHP